MTKAAARTGVGPTVAVAVEQHFPPDRRILDDGVAFRILPPGMRTLVRLTRSAPARDWAFRLGERSAPGIWGGVLCRKRYIDEKLAETADRIDAVVNLGAGSDTRACRLLALAGKPVWEVDQPENVAAKTTRLRAALGGVPPHVMLVPVDFDREDLAAALSARGWSADRRTFFVWEAVTQYLTGKGIQAILGFLAGAAPGSRLAFTYVRRDFIEGRETYGQERLHRRYVGSGLWIFGIDPEGVADLLGPHGWRVVEHLGYDELAARYVAPTGRDLSSTPIERMVYAEKS